MSRRARSSVSVKLVAMYLMHATSLWGGVRHHTRHCTVGWPYFVRDCRRTFPVTPDTGYPVDRRWLRSIWHNETNWCPTAPSEFVPFVFHLSIAIFFSKVQGELPCRCVALLKYIFQGLNIKRVYIRVNIKCKTFKKNRGVRASMEKENNE